MPSTRELRLRIKSVKSTRQITKAMELVATAKMRKASEATLASRPYVKRAQEVLFDIVRNPVEGLTHPLIADRPVKHTLAFLIASDRGLAGAYDANIGKAVIQLIREQQPGQELSFITMGRRVERLLRKLNVSMIQSYPHTPTHPTSQDLQPISDFMTEGFLSGKYDRVVVLFTNFTSMMVQEAQHVQLLPLRPPKMSEMVLEDREFLYEPSPLAVLNTVLPRLLEAQLYQALEESLASEFAARRIAMKNATDNASDMIDDLTLTYNGVRQGSITQELAEITGGAAALGA